MKRANRFIGIIAILAVTMGLTGCKDQPSGSFTQTTPGLFGPIEVSVELNKGTIENISVVSHLETPGVGGYALEVIPDRIIEAQSTDVDVVSGASISSRALIAAVSSCLETAGMKVKKSNTRKVIPDDIDKTTEVVIIGGGGAGLAAAVAATEAGSRVIIIEKTGFLGGNAIVSGGIFNCPDPALQDIADIKAHSLDSLIENALSETPVNPLHKEVMDTVREQFNAYKKTDKHVFDSPEWFALQTWNGGDKVGDLDMLLVYADNAFSTLEWLKDLGMTFTDKINSASGSLYMRTHTSTEPHGTGYIAAFRDNLAGKSDLIDIMTDTEGKSLIVEDGRVTGVNAQGKSGNKVTLHATKAVILATGGFAGNVEMRMKYAQSDKWPDLSAKVISTNMQGVSGDGIRMAQEVGANLINMNQIQLLPYANPWTGGTGDITLTYSGSIYINKNGERFVREDGRRDEMSLGIIAQPEGIMYQLFSADAVPDPTKGKTLGGMPPSYYIDNKLSGYVSAPTVAGLAEILKMNPSTLQKTIDDFNSYVEGTEVDPFGRITFTKKLLTGPWYAYPRKPAAHHTMGGVDIDASARALRVDGSVIDGLYCAGEVTGNLHGANRLGGNAIVDFCVFGRIAGMNAAGE